MLYDSYHVKISKIVAVLRKIFKHIVLISIVSTLVVATIVAFMATKGLIIDDSSISSGFEMTYGEYLPLKANALFAEVSYEYSSDGVEWSSEMPRTTGNYKVRACANGIFGQKRYGQVYSFTVNPKEIDVSVVEDEILYGELPTVEAELAFEDTISCEKVSYADRAATTTDVTPILDSVKITDADGNDVTKLYKLRAVARSIRILPRDIEVTVSDKEMIYNDTKFSYDGYELSDGELATGDVLQATFDKYLIDVGEILNTPVLRVVTSDGIDVSVHYEIATKIGKLKVDKRPLIIKVGSAEKEYDDTELVNKSFEITGEYKLVESHVANCVSNTSIRNAEEKENIIAIEIKNAVGEDKTPNYSLFYENGTLKITPRKINVISPSKEAVYNAIALNTEDTPIKSYIDRLVEGHSVSSTWASIIDAGSIENTVQINKIIRIEESEFGIDEIDVTKNYEIVYGQKGTLTVKKCPITITYESNTDIVYDGIERSFTNCEITGVLAENDFFEFEFPKFSQAGKYENKSTKKTVTSWREDGTVKTFEASENYEITEVAGTVEIRKFKLRLNLKNGEASSYKTYDGEVFTPSQENLEEYILPDGHTLDVKFKSTPSADVNRYPLDIESAKVIFGDKDATANFDISVDGKIEIERRPIIIKANDAEKVVDSEIIQKMVKGELPWTADEYEKYTVTDLVQGHNIELNFSLPEEIKPLSADASKILVSKYVNNVDNKNIIIKDENGISVTENYSIELEEGTLEIKKIRIRLVTDSVSKVYDGKELTCRTHIGFECKCSFELLDPALDNDKDTDGNYKFTVFTDDDARITNVGTKDNGAYLDFDNDDNEKYYAVEELFGKLTVIPRTLYIEPLGAQKEYDGKPLSSPSDYMVTVFDDPTTPDDGLISGHKASIKFETRTDIGESLVKVDDSYENIKDEKDNDVSQNYNIVIKGDEKLVVTKRKLIIRSETDNKLYDGLPLKNPNYTKDGLLTGLNHYIEGIEITGSQTEEGESPNTISGTAVIKDGNNIDVTKNYEITYKNGTLTVYKEVVAKVYSNKSGYIYLKTEAFGNYNYSNKTFDPSPEDTSTPYFEYNGNKYSYMLWSAANWNRYGKTTYNLEISDAKQYMLPYYSGFSGYNYSKPSYDSEDYTDLKSYTNISYDVDYYDYCFETQTNDYGSVYYTIAPDYITWVNDNYLVKNESASYELLYAFCDYTDCLSYYNYYRYGYYSFDKFIDQLIYRFGSIEELVNVVAKYVRSTATYDINYDRSLDLESDIAIAFLTDYREGIANHFATAATMLYRSLGIPARYVEGYIVETKAWERVDVKDAHSWVEVFIDGYGWMQMEVTSGFAGRNDGKTEITVKPEDVMVEYDGNPHSANKIILSEEMQTLFEDNGYRIESDFVGSQTQIGKATSRLENVKIYDAYGRDITYQFDIKTQEGTIEVTRIEIDVYLYGLSKTYDGKPLSYGSSKYFSIRDDAFKVTGYKLDLEVLFDNSDIHVLTVADINNDIERYVSFTVTDGNDDISYRYSINIVPLNKNIPEEEYSDCIVFEITQIQLVLETGSVTQYYSEGAVLECPDVKIVGGELMEGHTLHATAIGRLDKVGTINNMIDGESLMIVDEDGNDVTDKYDIKTNFGVLQFVQKPE